MQASAFGARLASDAAWPRWERCGFGRRPRSFACARVWQRGMQYLLPSSVENRLTRRPFARADSFERCTEQCHWQRDAVTDEKLPTDRPGATPEPSRCTGEFVSECIQPAGGAFALPAAIGEPALPLRFTWQGRTCEVREVQRQWKELDPDRTHGSGQLYLRRHWFELRMTDGSLWTVYFLRQPASGRRASARWWLYRMAVPSPEISHPARP